MIFAKSAKDLDKMRAVGELIAEVRETLRSMVAPGISEALVATAMGLKTEAAKNSIFRAVRKMRAALEPFVDTPRAHGVKGQTADACK